MIVKKVQLFIEKPLVQYYHVPGHTYATAVKTNMLQVMKQRSLSFPGITRSFLNWHWYGDGVFYVRMTTIIDMPRFTEGSEDKRVQKFQESLLCHEKHHFRISRKFTKKFFAKIGTPSAKELVDKIQHKYFQDLNKMHEVFDKETKHGCASNRYCDTIECPS